MNRKKAHDPALDMIRCTALLFVICVHFFLNTDFYDQTVSGIYMLIMSVMRNSFMICVPLFMMLTGYLIQTKSTSKNYYLKIFRVLYVYLIASLFCGFFKVVFLKTNSTLSVLAGIFSFQTAPYSWYIEMYIGFFLLIPFLNKMYDGLHLAEKQLLIVSMLLLTTLPSIFNIYDLHALGDLQWWIMPSQSASFTALVPDYWTELYPFTYFYLGKYLKEYPSKFTAKQIAVFSIFVFTFTGIFNYYRSYGHEFIWGPWQDYGSFFIMLQSVLVFCFFTKMNYAKLPSLIGNMLAKISDLSLGAYLTSWIFDTIIYNNLNAVIHTIPQKLMWFPVTVILVSIGSLMCSYVIDFSYSIINRIISKYTNQTIRN